MNNFENKLFNLIQDHKKECFTDPNTATDEEALGIMISQYFKWDGNKIFKTSYNAFEDSNFHSLNEKFENLWEKEVAWILELNQLGSLEL